jgi:integrase
MPNSQKPARLWLRKRKDGSPAIWVILHGGRQHGTGCAALEVAEAETALQTFIAENRTPDIRQRDFARIPCADVLSLYLDSLPDNSSRPTRMIHIANLDGFWGDKMLDAVTSTNCRAYVAYRPVKPATARLELKTLQTAINHWHRESPLSAVPRVTLPAPAPPKERVLNRREVAALLRACRKPRDNNQVMAAHVARLIRLCLATGSRSGAMLALSWMPQLKGGWIDVENGIIYRRAAGEANSSKRRPPTVLPENDRRMCQRWKALDAKKAITSVIHFHGSPVKKLRRSWTAIVKAAGLAGDVTPHTLKHTAVTWMVMDGMPMLTISRITGTDVVTLEKVYAHYMPRDNGSTLAEPLPRRGGKGSKAA